MIIRVVPSQIVISFVIGVIAMSWYYMSSLMTMNMEPVTQWNAYDLLMLFVMWTVMMFGMMLPSAVPVILLVNNINEQRLSRGAAYVHSGYFILGYLMAWTFYSLLITFIQYWLHHLALLTPMMVSAEVWFTSILFLLAGIYQWLPIKQRCLNVCRSPLGFIMKEWGEGINNAIKLGFKHGQYCLGCCWVLMGLLFTAGVMDLKWVLVLTLVILTEKLLPEGKITSRALGVGFIIYAMYLHV
ncbi:MAG: DUF2182 domain-containing protein [Aliivibrio sp.]|uniref:DUF2182 domain-containing protein n=1 Tax=Aliivibrio sp. TaxID=1872443 RepID=UPI001A508F21|nr:DUF2182 domain-containing protein [Aliivibrio sp.]